MAKLVTEQLKSGQFDYRNKNEIQIHERRKTNEDHFNVRTNLDLK
jgi:hypothetical protein